MQRLRLVKLLIQPVFVIDDGETLTETAGQPIVVSDADLDGFAEKFRTDMRLAEMNLNEEPAPCDT